MMQDNPATKFKHFRIINVYWKKIMCDTSVYYYKHTINYILLSQLPTEDSVSISTYFLDPGSRDINLTSRKCLVEVRLFTNVAIYCSLTRDLRCNFESPPRFAPLDTKDYREHLDSMLYQSVHTSQKTGYL